VPEVSRFFGIVVQMYYADHEPPASQCAGWEAVIAIETSAVLSRSLFTWRARWWAALHRADLMENWRLEGRNRLKGIGPLE
jgi:hypothetical protein